jgi:phosphoglycolate phosphatase
MAVWRKGTIRSKELPFATMTTIFLDLDGTLTDPKPGITGCIRHALQALGREAPEADALTWCIGPPLIRSFETLLGDPELAARGLVLYRERFGAVGLYENRVYDGVPEALQSLRAAGHTLHLATSKPHVYAERIMAHFGLDAWIGRVFGSELDGTRVDKGDLLAFALAETGAAPEQAIMIGDRSHDMSGARSNGMTGIGVLYGYGSEQELREAGARRLAARVEDLPVVVDRL